MFPPVDNRLEPLLSVIAPVVLLVTATAVPLEFARNVISPLLVSMVLSADKLMYPVACSRMSAPLGVEVMFCWTNTLPPKTLMDPATLIGAASVMLPVLVPPPIVRSLPAVVEPITLPSVTAKLVVLPSIVSEPLFKAVVIAETFTVEFAVTVKVPELIDQPDKELLAVEMVKV